MSKTSLLLACFVCVALIELIIVIIIINDVVIVIDWLHAQRTNERIERNFQCVPKMF